jgi:cytochrome P450 family 4
MSTTYTYAPILHIHTQLCMFIPNAHSCREPTPYMHAIREVTYLAALRNQSLFLRSDFIFKLLLGRRFQRALGIIRAYSLNIIQQRREELRTGRVDDAPRCTNLIDILMRSDDGSDESTAEIQNDVDTFMFGGHDTSSTGS